MAERTYYGKDPIEWLIRDNHRDKVSRRVEYLKWRHGADIVSMGGLHIESQGDKVSRLHLRTNERDLRVSFLPREHFMTLSQTVEETTVSMDFNEPDEEGKLWQGPRMVLHVSSPEYEGAMQCVFTPDDVDWERERVGHIFPNIDADRKRNDLLVTTRHGMIRLPLAANIYTELEHLEERLG